MAIRVERYDMDPLKGGKTRDRWDFNRRKARATLVLSGSVAGMVMTLQSPVPTAPPIVLTEAVDWNETIGDLRASLLALVATIESLGGGLLKSVGGVALNSGGDAEVILEAPSVGSWGEGITIDIDAAGANLAINGNPGPTTENLINGAGPDAVATFEDYLNSLPGAPTIAEVIILPLFTESSSFLVIWDDTP